MLLLRNDHDTTHKQSKHEGVRYDCDRCDSNFNDKSSHD